MPLAEENAGNIETILSYAHYFLVSTGSCGEVSWLLGGTGNGPRGTICVSAAASLLYERTHRRTDGAHIYHKATDASTVCKTHRNDTDHCQCSPISICLACGPYLPSYVLTHRAGPTVQYYNLLDLGRYMQLYGSCMGRTKFSALHYNKFIDKNW